MMQHVLQEPGSAVDPQRRVAYFLSQVVVSVTNKTKYYHSTNNNFRRIDH